MPLVAHSNLPTFKKLADEGCDVVTTEDAAGFSGAPELHIGFFNLMPDAALQATEQQFLRLLTAFDQPARLYAHPFTVAEKHRGKAARKHIATYYENFRELKQKGLDAMIITGANPQEANLTDEVFWDPMMEVIEWGRQNVRSMLCSCLATHAVFQYYHSVERVRLPRKRWGVYSHRVLDPKHVLVRGVAAECDGPHSHYYDLSREQMEQAGSRVLAESDRAGVYLAVSSEPCEFVFFQGHPEYDAVSLLKEYKREVKRYMADERKHHPRYPTDYLPAEAISILEAYKQEVLDTQKRNRTPPEFPDQEVSSRVANTWSKSGRIIYRNWLNAILKAEG